MDDRTPRSPYRGTPIEPSHPRRLEAVARAWGMEPAPPSLCEVLELGCGLGANLLPMAARAPASRFVGVDSDPEAIALAREFARRASVHNVEFVVADVERWTPRGTFDYVIAHGLFSWVSEAARDAVLEICRTFTRARGVAYVSYNAMPAWGFRDAIRSALIGVVEPGPEALRRRLELVRSAPTPHGSTMATLLDQEIEHALSQPDSYLEHEYRCPHHRAFSIREFCTRASAHGLQYLGDVAPTGIEPIAMRAIRATFASQATDRVDAEQLLDVAIVRQFRATLLVGEEVRLTPHTVESEPSAPAEVLVPARPCVHPLTRVEAESFGWVSTAAHSFRGLHPMHATLIEHLDGAHDQAALVHALMQHVLAGDLQLPTEDGSPPSIAQLEEGLPQVVASALEDFALEGLFIADDR